MGDNCEGCENAHRKIEKLEGRVSTLEDFKKWAKPILEDIKIIKNDSRWMIAIAIGFSLIVTYVYIYQIYPNFNKQNEDKIEIIREVQKIRIEMLEKLSTTESNTKNNIIKASKTNYKSLKKIIEKPLKTGE